MTQSTSSGTAEIVVNNGKRIAVSLPIYTGLAGFVDQGGGVAQISFKPNQSGSLSVGTEIEADGRRWTVQQVAASQYVRGMQVVTLQEVAE